MARDKEKDSSYEEMSKGGVYEQSEVPCYDPPAQNNYEKKRNSDFDQSGMKK